MVRRSKTAVADLMREWRHRAGLSQSHAAKFLRISLACVKDIEGGRRRTYDTFARIALQSMIADQAAGRPLPTLPPRDTVPGETSDL